MTKKKVFGFALPTLTLACNHNGYVLCYHCEPSAVSRADFHRKLMQLSDADQARVVGERCIVLPDVSEPTKGAPDCTDLLEVIIVLSKAPRDRFGRLQLYDQPYRDAAERLQEFACATDVGGARDTWEQLGKVCAATLQRLEK